jgi:UDP-GlcNAc:undecaprenyl-phosphate GlcNAc-1-phosphate transferase
MLPFTTRQLFLIAGAFTLSVVLTYLVRQLARQFGRVAQPKVDRWHKKPTAMLGGIAIFATVALGYVFFLPHSKQGWVLLGAGAFLFLVGLIDDLVRIKPYQKLIGQVMGASLVVFYGMTLPWTNLKTLNMVITIFWLVGITNAVNLLDNMDGLAAGIAAIAALVLALSAGVTGQPTEIWMLIVFISALVGFLVWNFNPASIFMGDCGSMFVGFFLAGSVLLNATGGRSRSLFSVLAVPVLILFVPIFDTTLVTVMRKLKGRAASQGGRDHTSHRLVGLGLSERTAVLMLYAFAVLAGALALWVRQLKVDQSLAAIVGFVIVLTLVGVYLAKVKVYDDDQAPQAAANRTLVAFLVDVSYKRRLFEVLLDLVLIVLCYYASYLLLFGAMRDDDNWRLFLRTVPILVCIKLAAFLWSGTYRGIWRYTSIGDLFVFAKGALAGSVASVLLILLMFRFEGFSRRVFLVDGVLLLVAITASRMAFRLFRQLIPGQKPGGGKRALIYGAGDAGELLLRELRNNPALAYSPVGFMDDDPLKHGKVIHGLKVFAGNGSLPKVCQDQDVDAVLISCRGISADRIEEIATHCREMNVSLQRLHLKIEPVE